MKIDMHYYGAYALARAAGITQDAARTIAHASQFVDESCESDLGRLSDGSWIVSETTAHHPDQAVLNYFQARIDHDDHDQRLIWVPFHFFPGGVGNDFTARLRCTKNGPIAQQMVAHHLTMAAADYALELMGVMAHVYADTFAHYGFSGVSSRRNRVRGDRFDFFDGPDPLTEDDKAGFLGRFGGLLDRLNIRAGLSDVAEDATGALGHGGVLTYPDLPYLHWRYVPEGTHDPIDRNNAKDYFEACRELHGRFVVFAARCDSAHRDLSAARNFDDIAERIRAILAVRADTDGRIAAWQGAVAEGALFNGPEAAIPPFDPRDWLNGIDRLKRGGTGEDARQSPVYRFFQAARHHRTYVLRDLLPHHGLVVI